MPDGVVSGYRAGLDMSWLLEGKGGREDEVDGGVARLDLLFTSHSPPSTLLKTSSTKDLISQRRPPHPWDLNSTRQ